MKKKQISEKNKKRERSDELGELDVDDADFSFEEPKKSVLPLKDSIKGIRLEEISMRLTAYNGQYNSFSLISWNVIDRHILCFLDYKETIALARTTRQWYCRIANIACVKFSIFLRQEIEHFFQEESWGRKRGDCFSPKLNEIKTAFEMITPMAIAYYSDIGRINWNKNFKRLSVVSKKKPWDYSKKMWEILLMFKRIIEHGNIDNFKAWAKYRNVQLDHEFNAKCTKRRRVLNIFRQKLLKEGYETTINLKILPGSHSINMTRFYHEVEKNDTEIVKKRKLILNKLWELLDEGRESEMRQLPLNIYISYLLDRELIFSIRPEPGFLL